MVRNNIETEKIGSFKIFFQGLKIFVYFWRMHRRRYFIKNLKRKININDICNLIKLAI